MPHNSTLLLKMGQAATVDDAMAPLLFHGCGAVAKGEPRPGGYDGVFWTAQSPDIAQTYIPRSGITTYLQIPRYSLQERIRPNKFCALYQAAVQMTGVSPDAEWDHTGQATSWSIPQGWPRHEDLLRWLQTEMGYTKAQADQLIPVLTTFVGNDQTYLKASHRLQGTLLCVDASSLKFFDYADGREGDLNEPDYHRIDVFSRLQSQGWDGVIINDWCQSPNWGNVGHLSYGIFPSAIRKIDWISVPAVAFDWPEGDLSKMATPEFAKMFDNARLGQRPAQARKPVSMSPS